MEIAPEYIHALFLSHPLFQKRRKKMESEEAFSFLIPFLFRELEGGMKKRREEEKPGKLPAIALLWAFIDPYCGSYQYIFIISKMQKKIKRNTIIHAISFLYSSFSKKNEGIY